MILTCPSCGTQYVVKDGAIPPGGRQVRCAACKHSWHQDPEDKAAGEPEGIEQAPAAESIAEEAQAEPEGEEAFAPSADEDADEDESLAEATLIEPRSGPEAEERAFEEAAAEAEQAAAEVPAERSPPSTATYANAPFDLIKQEEGPVPAAEQDWQEPPQPEAQDDEFTPFPAASEVEPKRRSPLLAILILVVAVVAIAAAFWFLAPPDLKARLGLAGAGTSPLALVTTHRDRQRLESGNELLTVTGRVINPTAKEQDVPPLQAQLKTKAGKIVYSWTIAPPARSLAPGASASFNSAEVNVPPGGEELTITLGSEAT
jgi:predicted Zn finger-like uncharacterized protein